MVSVIPMTLTSVAPFNTTGERSKFSVTENPGPGTYAADKVKVVNGGI
jgi:hypothetical protein